MSDGPRGRKPRGPLCVFGHPIYLMSDMIKVDGRLICVEHAWRAGQTAQAAVDDPGSSFRGAVRRESHLSASADRKAAEKRMQAAGGVSPGWVYYLRVAQLIKIGYTANVRRRLRAYPPDSKLLAVHPGNRHLERELHSRFAGSLARGREWFHPQQVLMRHIDLVVEQFGDPREFRVVMRHA